MSTERMPPPTLKGMKDSEAISRTTSILGAASFLGGDDVEQDEFVDVFAVEYARRVDGAADVFWGVELDAFF